MASGGADGGAALQSRPRKSPRTTAAANELRLRRVAGADDGGWVSFGEV